MVLARRGALCWCWDWSAVRFEGECVRVARLEPVRDVTARYRSELQMRRLATAIEQSADAVVIADADARIDDVGGLVASRNQEYLDGQRVTLVYDLAKLNLRPIIESDQELLAQRKAMEESHQFEIEHAHGAFRGNCSGVLTIDYLDVAYKPAAGEHGFRIPFKLLKISGGGKSVELYYLSDNKHFQSFKFQDERVAQRFRQIWGELKSIARTNP